MTLQVIYSVSAGVTSDISSRVFMASERLGLPGVSITQNAEEGSVGISTLVVDDPLSTLTLKGHRRIYFVETSAPAGQQVIANTYVGTKSISRGDWAVGPLARTFSVELADANTLISRRLVVGSDGNRPAETDIQRLTWLLATTEANEFNGPSTYINSVGPVAMDAVDYRKQSVSDILDDLAQASGKNWWVVYFEDVGEFGLWYDFDHATTYSSTISLSNDEADIDDSTVFAYYPTATVEQDPSRVYSGTIVEFDSDDNETTNWIYEQDIDIGNEFVFRDVSYPSFNVKSAVKARARALRYLGDSDTEEDIVKLSFVVPAAKVNALMHGHRVQVKGTHWAFSGGNDYSTYTWMRALKRTVTQLSSTHYRIDTELSPVPPTVTPRAAAYRAQTEARSACGNPLPIAFITKGDDAGFEIDEPLVLTVGPITWLPGNTQCGVNHGNWGGPNGLWSFQGSGTIDLSGQFVIVNPIGGETLYVDILINGSVVHTSSCVQGSTCTNGELSLSATGITINTGDVLEAQFRGGDYLDKRSLEIVGGSLTPA